MTTTPFQPFGDDERQERGPQDPGREDPIDRFHRDQDQDRSFDFEDFEEVDDDILDHEEDEGE